MPRPGHQSQPIPATPPKHSAPAIWHSCAPAPLSPSGSAMLSSGMLVPCRMCVVGGWVGGVAFAGAEKKEKKKEMRLGACPWQRNQ